jgi:regulator of protease activity HflC (stomatin/prohibitin superfamily)
MELLDIKKITLLAVGAIVLIGVLMAGHNLVENNDAGHFQVKQNFIDGKLSVRNTPGYYGQWFGKITTYSMSPVLDFTGGSQGQGASAKTGNDTGQNDMDLGGIAYHDTPFAVTFRGNSTADVGGLIKVRLPMDELKQIQLHTLYHGELSVVDTLVRQTVGEAVKLAGPMFTAEEARTTRREEYTSLVLEMINNGLYQTFTTVESSEDEDGIVHNNAVTKLKKDADGKNIVVKESAFKQFGISVIQFNIRGLDFDDVTQKLMMAKKQSEQEKIVARTRAQTAQQNAETAKQEGIAKVAEATAEENVKKTRQVVKSQADFESAQFARKQAEEEAKAKIAQGAAEAQVSRQKVAAGLSPLEKATIAKETAIGVAHELSQVQFPGSMVIVGGSNGAGGNGKVNPFEALGLESFYNLSNKMASQHSAAPRRAPAVADAKGAEAAPADDEK